MCQRGNVGSGRVLKPLWDEDALIPQGLPSSGKNCSGASRSNPVTLLGVGHKPSARAGSSAGLMQVEPGWHCTRTSPSLCAHADERLPDVPAEPQGKPDAPAPGGGSGPPPGAGDGGRRGSKGWMIAGLVLAGLSMVCAAAFVAREQIYDRFPQARAPGNADMQAAKQYLAAVSHWDRPGACGPVDAS